ncbi:MAG: sugar transporter [Lachnospiraceae bacterium]|nr:sugar transporter [Lachnospiraceae bacterium]
MAISEEYAKEHADSPAVLCCRAEKGVQLTSHNLEDPAIFDDLVDSGLLNLEGCLKIGQVIGSTLQDTYDSLTPLTEDKIDAIQEMTKEEPSKKEEAKGVTPSIVGNTFTMPVAGGMLKISIGEGKNIHVSLPLCNTNVQ